MIKHKEIELLHGAVGSYEDWGELQGALDCQGFATVAHDLYAYVHKEKTSLNQFAKEFVKDPSQSLSTRSSHPSDFFLMGYSLGGRLALHALLAAPDLWKKAVIISAHTGLDQHDARGRAERKRRDNQWARMAEDPNLPWSDFLSQWNDQGVLKSVPEVWLSWADRESLCRKRHLVAQSLRFWSLALQEDLLEQCAQLTIPILWVVGEQDDKFVEIAKKATAVLPNAELQIVPSSGHRVPWEQPEKFRSLVSAWL